MAHFGLQQIVKSGERPALCDTKLSGYLANSSSYQYHLWRDHSGSALALVSDGFNNVPGMKTKMTICRLNTVRLALPILALSLIPISAIAQTAPPGKPTSIGQQMEALTAKFNNPDPIVEMNAYNGAFANPNPIIRQMALSSAANSTNPEIRAIAVMGAMAHVKSLVLSFTAPKNSGQSNSSATNLYNTSGGMLTLQIEKFNSDQGSFLFVTDDSDKSFNLQQKNFDEGTITGDTVQMNIGWVVNHFKESCPAILSLKNGKLSGTMTCTGNYTLIRAPVTAKIF